MPIALLRAALAAIVACLLVPAIALADAGDPDPGFGTDGIMRFADDGSAPPEAARIEATTDGGAYVLTERGAYGGPPEVVRLTETGVVSSRLALEPPREDGVEYAAEGVARHPAGGYVVMARRSGYATSPRAVLVRHTAAGAVDTGFGTDGVAFLPEGFFVSGGTPGAPLLVLASGAVVVGGAVPDPQGISDVQATVVRMTSGGVLDSGFGSFGSASLGISGTLYDLATDGLDVLAVGSAGGHLLVARLDEDGALDDAFGTGGRVTRTIGDFSAAHSVTVGEASTVSVVGISGLTNTGSRTEGTVARFLGDGTSDPAFGEGGVRTSTLEADDTSSSFLNDVVEDNGRLYAVGAAGSRHSGGGGDTYELVTARFDTAGSLDTSFAGDGVSVLPDDQPGSGYESGTSAALDPDGRLLVAGNDQSKLLVTRLQTAPSAPVNEEPPAITDHQGAGFTPGDVLLGDEGRWRAYGTVTYAYAWERCDAATAAASNPTGCAAIAGATARNHTATDADARKHLRLVVTATRETDDGTKLSSRHASATALVEAEPPSNVEAPVVSPAGPVVVGETLETTLGKWEGTGPMEYDIEWISCRNPDPQPGRCDGGPLPGATSRSYTTTPDDVGRYIGARVLATNYNSQGNPQSPGFAYSTTRLVRVAEAGAVKPENTTPPTVTPAGPVTEGDTLTGSIGAWHGTEPIAYDHQWQRCAGTPDAPTGCEPIDGAGGDTYATGAGDAGKVVRLRVVARNGGGSADAVSSGREVRAKPAPKVEPEPRNDAAPEPKPTNPFGLTGNVVYQDTTVTKVMPDVRGLQIDAAKQRIEQAGIHAKVDVKEAVRKKPLKLPGKSRLDIGDVSGQSVSAGAKVTSGIGTPKAIRLVTEAGPKATKANGGPFGSVCTGKAARADLKGLGLGEVLDLLKAKKCTKVEVDYKVSAGAKEVEVRKAVKDGKELELKVVVPADPSRFDLTAIFRQGAFNGRPSFGQDDWALTADATNVMGIQVVNRAGKTVNGADVFVDASKVGADDLDGSARGGVYVTGFKPTKAGVAHVLVSQRDSAGNRIFGFGRFSVVSRRAPFTAIDGRRYSQTGALAAGARASGIREIFAALGGLAQSLGAGVAKLFSGPVSEQTISTASKQNVGLAQLSLGNLLSGNARVVAAGGANVVAAGGANVVAPGGANVVAPGGANVVAPGGANVVAAGGANVVAAGGLNMISLASGNVVAAGGLNLIGKDTIANGSGTLMSLPAQVVAAGGANVVAAGGGNLISDNGLGVVAAGGLNLIGTASGNLIGTASGN